MTTAVESARMPDLGEALAEILPRIDNLLASYPESGIEARRRITCELHFEPRAEELQTIARIASDEATDGPRFEVPRALLALRLIADRELKRLYEMMPVERDAVVHLTLILPEIATEARRMEVHLGEIASDDTLIQDDREFLLQMGDSLTLSRDRLLTAAVMAARLARIVTAATEGSLDAETQSLTVEERAAIAGLLTRGAIDPGEPVLDAGSSRARVDALLLRSHVDNLLATWDAMGDPTEDDPIRRQQRDALLEHLRQARIAVDTVASRIQNQQDDALLAGLHAFADELRQSGRGLFATKLRMAPVLRAPYENCAKPDADSVRATLEECSAAEAALEHTPRKQSEEEIYLGALQDMRNRRDETERALPAGRRSKAQRDRRRVMVMGLAAGVLAVASAIVNFVILPRSDGGPQAPTVVELKPIVDATQVDTAGPVMFTHVDNWNELDAEARRKQISKLGGSVSDDGFSTVFIINEFGDPAAMWSREGGGALVE